MLSFAQIIFRFHEIWFLKPYDLNVQIIWEISQILNWRLVFWACDYFSLDLRYFPTQTAHYMRTKTLTYKTTVLAEDSSCKSRVLVTYFLQFPISASNIFSFLINSVKKRKELKKITQRISVNVAEINRRQCSKHLVHSTLQIAMLRALQRERVAHATHKHSR